MLLPSPFLPSLSLFSHLNTRKGQYCPCQLNSQVSSFTPTPVCQVPWVLGAKLAEMPGAHPTFVTTRTEVAEACLQRVCTIRKRARSMVKLGAWGWLPQHTQSRCSPGSRPRLSASQSDVCWTQSQGLGRAPPAPPHSAGAALAREGPGSTGLLCCSAA